MGVFHPESQVQPEGLTTQEGTSLVPKLPWGHKELDMTEHLNGTQLN